MIIRRCVLAALFLLGLGLGMGCMYIPPVVVPEIDYSIGDYDALLDRYTDSRIDHGSAMQLLLDGAQAYPAFRGLIENAREHIHIETLNFDNDTQRPPDLALEFAQLLADKAEEGVEVRVIADKIAQRYASTDEINDLLRNSKIKTRFFFGPGAMPFQRTLYRQHKKMLIVDGRTAIIGGMNYGRRYLSNDQWRDTNVMLTGPVVASVQREFLRDWEDLDGCSIADPARYFPLLMPTGDLGVRVLDQRPLAEDFDINYAVTIALHLARRSVLIEAPYFNPSEDLLAELLATAARGVEVCILTNDLDSMDIADAFYQAAYWFETLLDNGIRLFLWQRAPRTMHSKAMVVDDDFAMVSSFNFNLRSILWDTENGAIFRDPPAVQAVRQMIETDLNTEWTTEIDAAWIAEQPDELWETARLLHTFYWFY